MESSGNMEVLANPDAAQDETMSPGQVVDRLIADVQQPVVEQQPEPQAAEQLVVEQPVVEQPVAKQEPDYITVVMGGIEIDVPADMPEDQIKANLSRIRSSPEFDQYIDKETGAPNWVRLVVGAGANEKERIQTIQNIFPDVIPYGQNNFIFTSPETGKYTLYNEKGFGVGDVFSVGRELTQGVATSVGAAVGGYFTGGLGTYAGAGLGNYIGGQALDLLTMLSGAREFEQTGKEVAVEAAVDIAFGAVFEKIGRSVSPLLKRLFGGGTPEGQAALQAFAKANVTPTAGSVSPSLAQIEGGLKQIPFSGQIIVKRSKEIVDAVKRLSDDLTKTLGRPGTPQAAGEVAKEAAKRAMSDAAKRINALEAPIIAKMGEDNLVTISNIKQTKAFLEAEIAKGPFWARAYKPTLAWINDIEATGPRTYANMKAIKTQIGQTAFAPPNGKTSPQLQSGLRDLYFALGRDMVESASKIDPSLAKDVAKYNRYWSMYSKNSKEFLTKLSETDAPHTIYNRLVSQSRGGDTTLLRMKKNFKKEEWDDIAATMFNELGLSGSGAQNVAGDAFSPSVFLTNWNKISKEAKNVMFSGESNADLRGALDALVSQTDSLKRLEKYTNHSNSGGAVAMATLLGALGGTGGTMAGAGISGGLYALGVATGIVGGSALAARLLTFGPFVRWLARPIDETGEGFAVNFSKHIARLPQMAAENEFMKSEIYEYMSALRDYTQPSVRDKIIMQQGTAQ